MASSIKGKPVLSLVVWDDAWSNSTEQVSIADAHEHHRPLRMQTVGWVVIDDPTGVSLFNERCLDQGEESYRGRTLVPRAMILSVNPINLSPPRKPREKVPPLVVALSPAVLLP